MATIKFTNTGAVEAVAGSFASLHLATGATATGIDTTPTTGSSNLITSGGVKSAISSEVTRATASEASIAAKVFDTWQITQLCLKRRANSSTSRNAIQGYVYKNRQPLTTATQISGKIFSFYKDGDGGGEIDFTVTPTNNSGFFNIQEAQAPGLSEMFETGASGFSIQIIENSIVVYEIRADNYKQAGAIDSDDGGYTAAYQVYEAIMDNKFDIDDFEELSGTFTPTGTGDYTTIACSASYASAASSALASEASRAKASEGSLASAMEIKSNKVTGISSSATNTQYPSALAVYNYAYNKPAAGIPETDFASEAQTKLNNLPFVKGTQTAKTGTWTGNAPTVESLYTGLAILYYLPYAGSGSATLNLTLEDGTQTGAVNCYYSGTTRLSTHYGAGNTLLMTYVAAADNAAGVDGWWAQPSYYTTDNYNLRYNTAIKAKTAITAGALVGAMDDTGYYNLGPGVSFSLKYHVLWESADIAKSKTATTNYTQYGTISLASSVSGFSGLTTYKPVYLVGTVSGSTFTIDSTTMFTQTEPASVDGKCYMRLGFATNATTNVLLVDNKPIFVYENGAFIEKDFSLNGAESASNKVTSITSSSTDTQYPSAKAAYTFASTTVACEASRAKASEGSLASAMELKANKITAVSSTSTDTQYPSAKAAYTLVMDNKFDVSSASVASGVVSLTGAGDSSSASFASYASIACLASTASTANAVPWTGVSGRPTGIELTSNKVTTLSSSATDTQYPSAKCVYDIVGDVVTALETLLG